MHSPLNVCLFCKVKKRRLITAFHAVSAFFILRRIFRPVYPQSSLFSCGGNVQIAICLCLSFRSRCRACWCAGYAAELLHAKLR
jgi:hypothetical protein